jgi:diguanylate cyclase (GGDEF)-like protein/PAS domain S-box-containing protein
MHSARPVSSRFERRILGAFLLAVLIVSGMAAMTWKVADDANAAALRVAHTHDVLNGLARVRVETLQIELSTQNFRLTGDPARLTERDRAIARREIELDRVRTLTSDHPAQSARWTQLRAVIDERLGLSRRIEALRRNEGQDAANAFVAAAPLRETRERVDRILGEMDNEERRLLVERNVAQKHSSDLLVGAGGAVLILMLALLGATYGLIRRQLSASEGHLRTVISRVPALIAYVDAQQRYVYVNGHYRERFAPHHPDIAGRSVREVLGETRYAIAAPLIAKALQGEPQSYDWEPFPGVWQVINYMPRQDERGDVTGYYVLGADITERKRAEERIRLLNRELEQRVRELERVSRALRTLSAGNRAMLRATGEHELLDSMCRALVEVGAYPMAVVWLRNAAGDYVPTAQCGHSDGIDGLRAWAAANASDVRTAMDAIVAGGQARCFNGTDTADDYALPTPAGGPVIACPLRVGGSGIGLLTVHGAAAEVFGDEEMSLIGESADDLAYGVSTLRTHAEQARTREAMYRLTQYDLLTGLPNQTLFSDTLAAELRSCRQHERPFALLQMNIERLSEINDALGFTQGDQILCEFGGRLSRATPDGAFVARLRGDEFALLLPDSDRAAALSMARRLREVLSQPFQLVELPIDVSTRTGIALYPDHGSTPHDLYRHMDIAVRQAKKQGVDCVVFDPALYPAPSHRLNMAGDLRRAIEADDLRLYLQPKVDMRNGIVCGAEALVRWQHATRGLIPPSEFIELAEHTGLIRPLAEWMIANVLRLNRQWDDAGRALPIAVNLSARNLRDEDLVDKIRQMLAHWGTASGLLEIEITESAVMEDADFALRVLHGLRAEGIRLYIDDFGTGYSSLSYLQKLPVGCIKIDQSFVRAMAVSSDSAAIVRSTIDLVHDLGRKVVAEGVETQQHWDALCALGCDVAQGYLIARPMPAEDFPAWLDRYQPMRASDPADGHGAP